MDTHKKEELLWIGYRISREVFLVYLFSGFGFLVAETVLPGIFSQRIDFFFFYIGILLFLGLVFFLGRKTHQEELYQKGCTRKEKGSWKEVLWIIAYGVFFLLVMRDVSYAFLPIVVIGSALVCWKLMQDVKE